MDKNRLNGCKSLQEIFQEVALQYDLTQPLGPMVKMTVIQGIDQVLKMIKAPKK